MEDSANKRQQVTQHSHVRTAAFYATKQFQKFINFPGKRQRRFRSDLEASPATNLPRGRGRQEQFE